MPTQWLEWSEEAFRRAREEDKPILLFLGTRWCSVCRSLDEVFWGDADVSDVIHRDYVPVRVDAEERPDINERYNVGGWPTTAFLTPQGSLLWGTASGDPAQLRQTVMQLKAGFVSHRDRLEEEIRRRDEKVEQARRTTYTMPSKLDAEAYRKTVRGIVLTFDGTYGGFGREPKFPMTASLHVLLSALQETGGADLREIVTRTLDAIGERGLYDPVGGGFFRYCESESWTRPHTEKLCEENAGLIRAFLEGWILTGEPRFRDRAVRSFQWVLDTLWNPETSLLYGSQAADEEYYSLPPEKRRQPPPVVRIQLTSAAAQMCSTLLRGAAVLSWGELSDVALRCLGGIVQRGVDPERGTAQCFDSQPRIYGLARTQAYLSRAWVDAYEFTGRREFLESAESLLDRCRRRLWFDEEGGILDREPGAEEWGELSRRRKNIQDNALVAESALRLAHLGREGYAEFARRILASFPDFQDDYGHYTAEYAAACDLLVRPVLRIDLVSVPDSLRRAALAFFASRKVIRHASEGRPGAHVLRGSSPLGIAHTPEDLLAMI